jgi:phosphoribosylglycinamide formyltransferase-1
MKRIVVLVSGRGSNFAALLDANLPAEFAAVISNRPGAPALDLASTRNVPTITLDHTLYPDRESFDLALAKEIDRHQPDVVVLAGFMRVLTENFVNRYRGQLVNIHPSLLPAFPGLDTHERALAAGVRIHGCTVHFVTPQLDHGPIIIQAAVAVHDDDDAAALAARVLAQEHRIYPLAVRWLLEGRLKLAHDGKVFLSGALPQAATLVSPGSAE